MLVTCSSYIPLARSVYEEQVTNKWPGLVQEVEHICLELGVESAQKTKMSKKSYRSKLTEACHTKNKERIKYESLGKVKCERILAEEYGRKEYVDSELVSHVRDTYRARFGLLPFAGNFKNDKRFSGNGGLCRCSRNLEDEPHLLSGNCEVFGDIRVKYGDLRDNESLVRFLAPSELFIFKCLYVCHPSLSLT